VNVSQRYDQLMMRAQQKHLEDKTSAEESMRSLKETLERVRAARLASEQRIKNITRSWTTSLPSYGGSAFSGGGGGGGGAEEAKAGGGAGGGDGGDESVVEEHAAELSVNGADGGARADAPPSPMQGDAEGDGGADGEDDANARGGEQSRLTV